MNFTKEQIEMHAKTWGAVQGSSVARLIAKLCADWLEQDARVGGQCPTCPWRDQPPANGTSNPPNMILDIPVEIPQPDLRGPI